MEGRAIQRQLKNRGKGKTSEDIARSFAKLMMEGKVKRAINLLTSNEGGGVLEPTEEIKAKLREKHPNKRQLRHPTCYLKPIPHKKTIIPLFSNK